MPRTAGINTQDIASTDQDLYLAAAKHKKVKDILIPEIPRVDTTQYAKRLSSKRMFLRNIPVVGWIYGKIWARDFSQQIDHLVNLTKAENQTFSAIYKVEKQLFSFSKNYHTHRSLLSNSDNEKILKKLEQLRLNHKELKTAWRKNLRSEVKMPNAVDNKTDATDIDATRIKQLSDVVANHASKSASHREASKWAYIQKQINRTFFARLATTNDNQLYKRILDPRLNKKVNQPQTDEAKFFHSTDMDSMIKILTSGHIRPSYGVRPGVWVSSVPELAEYSQHKHKEDKELECGVAFEPSIQWQPIHQNYGMPNFLFKKVDYRDMQRIWVSFKGEQKVIEKNQLAPKVAYLYFSSTKAYENFLKRIEHNPELSTLVKQLQNTTKIKILSEMNISHDQETAYPAHWQLKNWHMAP